MKPALPILMATLAKQLTGMNLTQLTDATNEAPTEENSPKGDGNSTEEKTPSTDELASDLARIATNQALENYNTARNAHSHFSDSVSALVEFIASKKDLNLPLFILIDELDRCRPTFSIELLETIKHLFDVKGIYFIIATDSEQLSHSIKAVYGNDFDATTYLKRFFAMEYNFEEPDSLRLSEFFLKDLATKSRLFVPHEAARNTSLAEFYAHIVTYFKLTARDQEQVFELFNTCVIAYSNERKIHLLWLLFIICIRHKFHSTFTHMKNNNPNFVLTEFLKEKRTSNKLASPSNFPTFLEDNGGNLRSGTTNLESFFQHYFIRSTRDIEKIRNGPVDSDANLAAIDRSITSNFQRGQPHDLRDYYTLVSQAGRFSD